MLLHYRVFDFLRMLRRVRWLLLSLIVIFALNTPGEYVHYWPFELAPTYEGLADGLVQSLRLCMMLAALSLLLATTSRDHVIAGFYLLLWPLRILHLQPERFAARLWLTLQYVERGVITAQSPNKRTPWQQIFAQFSELAMADDPSIHESSTIQMVMPHLRWLDGLAIILIIGISLIFYFS